MRARYVVNEKGDRREVILPVEEYERLRVAGEEQEKMEQHPGVVFGGSSGRRRASLSGTVYDVWEVVDLYKAKGRERMFDEHPISKRQLKIVLDYYEAYPEEVDACIEENNRPPEYWMEHYPEFDMKIGP